MVHVRKKAAWLWKFRRFTVFESRRGIYVLDKFILLDLQSTAATSFEGACFALDWIHDSFIKNKTWNPLLEPLLEQLRRDTRLLLQYRMKLIITFLLAGIYGANFCWLEARCNISTMAEAEIKEAAQPSLGRLYKMYYDCAVADGWIYI